MIKKKVEAILIENESARNSDAILIVNVWMRYHGISNSDTIRLDKLIELFRICAPHDIVRWRQKFNSQGKYLATNEAVIKQRRKRIKKVRKALGYQQSAIFDQF